LLWAGESCLQVACPPSCLPRRQLGGVREATFPCQNPKGGVRRGVIVCEEIKDFAFSYIHQRSII